MKQVFRSLQVIIKLSLNHGVFILAALLIFFPFYGFSQKRCTNPPVVNLSESSGSTCYPTSVTVSNNTFGGSATGVTITTDGHGSLVPSSTTSSPFDFTYAPANNDAGRIVTITITTMIPQGSPCKAVKATYKLTINSGLPAPKIEKINQPTCTLSTGSVELSGLPSYADWIVTIIPEGMSLAGSGTTAIIPNLPAGTYTFTVSISTECVSLPSGQAEIVQQPITPASPIPGTITAPTCTLSTGSVNIGGLPSSGTWTLTRYPGTIRTSGTGTTTTVPDLPAGTFNFTVTNEQGCVSGLSVDVTIPAPSPAPLAPVIRTITQPTLEVPTGSVDLTGLPSMGTWTILRYPGEVATTGTGTDFTITGLETGIYTFRVRNYSGCLSPESAVAEITAPNRPELVITDPPPVCYPATVDLTAPTITEGSTVGLIYTYWKDDQAAMAMETPTSASDGTYYIKGTSSSGFYDIKPVKATVKQPPLSNAGPDQTLGYQYTTILDASLGDEESGIWTSDSANVIFNDATDPHSSVRDLLAGNNVLSWIVTNSVCPADTDKVIITAGELVIPTLITPNGDTRNDYFEIQGLETLGKTELTVFDRRGIQIFRNNDYDNRWDGVDNNGKPLMNDTYFFLIKSTGGKSYTGYIVIRK